jgi:RNA polymerase sigma-70 factor (ECF subfamily)
MPGSSNQTELNTVALQGLIDRFQAGDASAAEQLLGQVAPQLERMARKMLKGYPGVARWDQTDDVLQNAVLRLLNALKEVRPDSVRAFFGLAAEMMRRELLDLVRHYRGAHGLGANHASVVRRSDFDGSGPAPLDPAESMVNADELDLWAGFHVAVERLPAELREVVNLRFYHGRTQVEIAELFQVNERTIRRRWREACQQLHDDLRGRLPDLNER